jgi:Alpha/beta hydrolase family
LPFPETLKVVFVHGTWGRGIFYLSKKVAPWCEANSIFVSDLSKELKSGLPSITLDLLTFSWSGANSITKRWEAALCLRNFIRELGTKDPILVIGHSHGGTISLQAICSLEEHKHILLATLATPFVRIVESDRDLGAIPANLFRFLVGFTMFVANMFIIVHMHPMAAPEWPFIVTALLFLLLPIPVGWYLGNRLNELIVNPKPREDETPSTWQLKPQLLASLTEVDAKQLGTNLLIVRGIDDEAALSLAAGAIGTRLSRFIFETVVGLGFLSLGILPLFHDTTNRTPFGYVQIYEAFIFFLALSSLMAPSVFRAVFGKELLAGALRCDVLADSVPDGDSAKVVTLRSVSRKTGLSHSIYNNPFAPSAIANWTIAKLRS